MEEDVEKAPNIDPRSDIHRKQLYLRLKTLNLARRIDSLRSCCVENFVSQQLHSEKVKSEDSTEKIALIENRLSLNQLEAKIDRLLENGFSKTNFGSKILRRQSSRNLASILKKYGRTSKQKFQNLLSKRDDFKPRNFDSRILKIYDHKLKQSRKYDSDATDYEDLFSSDEEGDKKVDTGWLAEKSYLKSRKFFVESQLRKIDASILQFAEFYKRVKMAKIDKLGKSVEDDESCARIREFTPRLRTRLIDLQSMKKNSTCGECFPPFSSCINCVFPKNIDSLQGHDYTNLETALNAEFSDTFYNEQISIDEEVGKMLKEKCKVDPISTEQQPKTPSIPKLLPTKKPTLKRRISSSSSSSSASSSSSSSGSSSETPASTAIDVYDFVDDDEEDPDWSAGSENEGEVKKPRKRRSSKVKNRKTSKIRGRKPKGGKIAGKLAKGQKRSKANNSTYDIDNIVIDSSVAAVSRIEILQYKEIDTPGWRLKDMEECKENSSENEEKIDDQNFLLRHQEPECKEHEMFQRVQAGIFQRKSVTLHPHEEKPKASTNVDNDVAAAL